jgi:integrase
MMTSLTATGAQTARPRATAYWLWSKQQKGFGLRVQPSGSKAYYHVVRVNGSQKFTRIAAFGEIEFGAALNIAKELSGQAARARTVEGAAFQPEKLVKPAELERGPLLLAEAWSFYFDRHLKSKASGEDAQKKVLTNVAQLLPRSVSELDREAVIGVLNGIEAVGVRRHVLQALKAACNYAAAHPKASNWPQHLANPFRGIKVPKLDPRNRKLTGTDLVNFGKVAAAYDDHAAGTFLLGLTVSGARLNELREARVHEWDSKRRRLRLGASRMKADRDGVLVFGPAVAARMDALVKGKPPGAAIFPGGDPQGFRDFRKPLAAVLKAAECRPVTFHDLRRSCGAALVTAKFDHAVIHQYLNHVPDAVTRSYLTLDHDDERRDEMAAAVEAALGLKVAGKARRVA